MGSACSMHGAMSSAYEFRPKYLKGRDSLEEINVDGVGMSQPPADGEL